MTTSTVSYTVNQYIAVGSVTPSYDNNANLTFDGVFTYGYDAENRLTSLTAPRSRPCAPRKASAARTAPASLSLRWSALPADACAPESRGASRTQRRVSCNRNNLCPHGEGRA
jgi:hypothetical protein